MTAPVVSKFITSAKDSAPYVGIGTGGTMTQTPVTWVQLLGLLIGGLGFVAAMLRWYEVKRSNDLDREKWEYQRESQNHKETEETIEESKQKNGS